MKTVFFILFLTVSSNLNACESPCVSLVDIDRINETNALVEKAVTIWEVWANPLDSLTEEELGQSCALVKFDIGIDGKAMNISVVRSFPANKLNRAAITATKGYQFAVSEKKSLNHMLLLTMKLKKQR